MSDIDLIYPEKTQAPLSKSEVISKQKRILTNKQVSKQERKQVNIQEREEVKKEASIEERIIASLESSGLRANTFRYTDAELDFIRDIAYEAQAKYKVKLDKNDIARIGLQWLIEDYKAKKEESVLVKILTSKKRSK